MKWTELNFQQELPVKTVFCEPSPELIGWAILVFTFEHIPYFPNSLKGIPKVEKAT